MSKQLCQRQRARIIVHQVADLEQLEPVHLSHLVRAARALAAELRLERDAYLRANWVTLKKRGPYHWATDPTYCELGDIWVAARDEAWKLEHALVEACLRSWPTPR